MGLSLQSGISFNGSQEEVLASEVEDHAEQHQGQA
jgi:hypothetical protein